MNFYSFLSPTYSLLCLNSIFLFAEDFPFIFHLIPTHEIVRWRICKYISYSNWSKLKLIETPRPVYSAFFTPITVVKKGWPINTWILTLSNYSCRCYCWKKNWPINTWILTLSNYSCRCYCWKKLTHLYLDTNLI